MSSIVLKLWHFKYRSASLWYLAGKKVTSLCFGVKALTWDLEVCQCVRQLLTPCGAFHYRSPSPLGYCPCVHRGSGVRGEETRETCTGGGHGKNRFGFNSKHVKRWRVGPARRGGQGLVTIYGAARGTLRPSLIDYHSLLITLILVFGWHFNSISGLFGRIHSFTRRIIQSATNISY